ncbi:VOC family protein [Allorhizocola rhizosphaerae]|uniref:VOC family protein n=1 Tax=Allorhizocola rhizosphaerae TaxID=1872709 RepID=UPI001FE7417E|nr:VOC family protein [Allorhizocola rhizosphaerae]
MSTLNFYVDDLNAAKEWYTEVLGIEPYFVREVEGRPAYIEFRIGDHLHEFGFIDARFAPPGQDQRPAGAVLHWHVDDIEASLERLVSLGARVYLPVTEHGPGFVTASVIDPFGNILGIMYNQHYLDMLEEGRA